MPIPGSNRIHINPRNPAHLRSDWWRVQKEQDDDTTALETLDGYVGPNTATFDSTAVVGQPVYSSSDASVDLADASGTSTADVIGVVTTGASATEDGEYITGGSVTTTDWTSIIGSGTLTPGAKYYLSTTAGQLTATPPSSTGEVVIQVGIAATTLLLEVNIKNRILL